MFAFLRKENCGFCPKKASLSFNKFSYFGCSLKVSGIVPRFGQELDFCCIGSPVVKQKNSEDLPESPSPGKVMFCPEKPLDPHNNYLDHRGDFSSVGFQCTIFHFSEFGVQVSASL